MSGLAALVKGCPLFFEIYEHEIENIIQSCLVASYDHGDFIMKQGDEGTDICILLNGKADITIDKNGQSTKVAGLNSGDLFGELVLINETKRTANIVASEPCDVLILSYENFFKFFEKNPKVFSLMVLNVTRLITKRLKSSTQKIEQLSTELSERSSEAA